MQPVSWYIRRLKSMSPSEIIWRLSSELRDSFDSLRFKFGRAPDFDNFIAEKDYAGHVAGFDISSMPVGEWNNSNLSADEMLWREKLINKADLLLEHKHSYFNLDQKNLGNPIKWNYDHSADKTTPLLFWKQVDYRDFKQSGDCKQVWEPNRHHHLVVLARAYRATGEIKYAREVMEQLESWLDQNPFGYGMNWRSPLELGVRIINWVWALDLIKDAGLMQGEIKHRLFNAIYLHCWDNMRKLSQGSSANNHLIGEVAGVFVAGSYFRELPNMKAWANQCKDILEKQLFLQTFSDGCTREHALGYEFFVIQFYLICGLVGKWTGQNYSKAYWDRLEKMFEFVALMDEGANELPMFGDRDDGYVLDLGSRPEDVKSLLPVGATIFNRPDFKAQVNSYSEMAEWLLGSTGREKFTQIENVSSDNKLQSIGFPESGYYLLQSGSAQEHNLISIFVDCTELGYGSIAAHGHADALSFSLRYNGTDVFVDPGTYDYFTYPEWRNHFRKTLAHNTVEVDGLDQSEMLGPFLWGKRAETRCLDWQINENGGILIGQHDGYTRLNDPVIHQRKFELDNSKDSLIIEDKIEAKGRHDIRVTYQLSEHCSIVEQTGQSCVIEVNGSRVKLEIDAQLKIETITGSTEPKAGWISRGYHQKTPATVIYATGQSLGNSIFTSKVHFPKT